MISYDRAVGLGRSPMCAKKGRSATLAKGILCRIGAIIRGSVLQPSSSSAVAQYIHFVKNGIK